MTLTLKNVTDHSTHSHRIKKFLSRQKKFVLLHIENCFWVYRKEPGKPGEKVGLRRRKSTERIAVSVRSSTKEGMLLHPLLFYLCTATGLHPPNLRSLAHLFLENKPSITDCATAALLHA